MPRFIIGFPRLSLIILAFLPLFPGLSPVEVATAGQAEMREADRKDDGAQGEHSRPDKAEDVELESLRREVREKPSEASLLRLGELLLKKGDADGALKSFHEALKINPRSLDARIGRGAALVGLGELDKAEEALHEAIPLNPNPSRVHYELGRLYERRGDYGKAVSQFKEGLKELQEGMR